MKSKPSAKPRKNSLASKKTKPWSKAKARHASSAPNPPARKRPRKARAVTGKAKSKAPAIQSATQQFEELLKNAANTNERYVLRLYVTGTTPRSTRAVQNLRGLCDRHLEGRYDLEIIDIYQQPRLASGDQIIAAPTLIKELPVPIRKVIGDLSNEQDVLMGLDLVPSVRPDPTTPQR